MIILTRFLYIKEDVLCSLLFSILDKDKEQSLFWAYELYYSGFEAEVNEYLFCIFRQCFSTLNPHLVKNFTKWSKNPNNPCYVGHMILNLCSPVSKYEVIHFLNSTLPELDHVKPHAKYLVILFPEEKLKKYNNETTTLNRMVLKEKCTYKAKREWGGFMDCCHCNFEHNDIFQIQTCYWLYFASFSPLWKQRIVNLKGNIDHENETIVFENDDCLEEFYTYWGYEPDEQSIQIQQNICPSVEQYFDKKDFIRKYGNVIRKKKKTKETGLVLKE